MNNPTISVIVPVYNASAYLNKCIDSILAQTYRDFELILVNDGSTDDSLAVCNKYAEADSRIIALNKENGGQGTARNAALDRACGEYIAFVDADDSVKPEMLEQMLKALRQTESDMAVCGIAVDNGIYITDKPVFAEPRVFSTAELMREYVTTAHIFTGPCNKLYKACLFEDIRFPSFRANEDAYIMHRLLGGCKKAVHLGKCLYIQYLSPASTERTGFSEKNSALLDCAQSLIDYFKDNFPEMLNLVAYKKVNDTAYLMRKIYAGFSHRKNADAYKELSSQLWEAYRAAEALCPDKTSLNATAKSALAHPFLFRLNSMKYGMKNKIKNAVKFLSRAIGRK